jgi:hypothetical protein
MGRDEWEIHAEFRSSLRYHNPEGGPSPGMESRLNNPNSVLEIESEHTIINEPSSMHFGIKHE